MSSDILPPISEVTPTNQGALVLITNGFGLCLVLIFTIIRAFARLFINPPFDRDDLLMGVATVSIPLRVDLNIQSDRKYSFWL